VRELANYLQDLNLPKSIVQRLAKGVLPANTQIQKDALLAMSKSATVFVNYLTSWYFFSLPYTYTYSHSFFVVPPTTPSARAAKPSIQKTSTTP
jgi:hypothetical protein